MSSQNIPIRRPDLEALFTAVKGEAGLQALLDDFYSRMSDDVMIGFFFDGKDLKHIASMQKQFLMKAMGAASSYSGLAPADAHLKLAPILTGFFDRRLQILRETLADHGLNTAQIETWIKFENAFRDGIITSKK